MPCGLRHTDWLLLLPSYGILLLPLLLSYVFVLWPVGLSFVMTPFIYVCLYFCKVLFRFYVMNGIDVIFVKEVCILHFWEVYIS